MPIHLPCISSLFRIAVFWMLAGCFSPVMAEPDSDAVIQQAVNDLGADGFRDRKKARRVLWEAGARAVPALTEAVKSTDPEVAIHARKILDKINLGIYPDTPAELVSRLERYHQGNHEVKSYVLQELFNLGTNAYSTLVQFLRNEQDEAIQSLLQVRLAYNPVFLLYLLDQQPDVLTEFFFKRALEGDEDAMRQLAAMQVLLEKADQQIEGLLNKVKDEAALKPAMQRLRAYLHRARGETDKALGHAEKSGDALFYKGLLFEKGKFAALLELAKKAPLVEGDLVELSLRCVYYFLLGEETLMKDKLNEFVNRAQHESWTIGFVVETLIICEQVDKAIQVLKDRGEYRYLFQLYEDLVRYDELEGLMKLAREEQSLNLPELEMMWVRFLALHGEQEQAEKGAQPLFERLKNEANREWQHELLSAAAELGMKDKAFEWVAEKFSQKQAFAADESYLVALFSLQGGAARIWWRVLKSLEPSENEFSRLHKIDRYLAQTEASDDFLDKLKALEKLADKQPREAAAEYYQLLSSAYLQVGQTNTALRFMKARSAMGGAQDEADLALWYARQEQWEQASELYGTAWDKAPHMPGLLYLQGYALKQAGRQADGDALMAKAHRYPLADSRLRSQFAYTVHQHEKPEAALKQFAFMLRTDEVNSPYLHYAYRQYAGLLLKEQTGFEEAVLSRQLHLLALLQEDNNSTFWEYVLYDASMIRCARAFLQTEQGEQEKALEQAMEAFRLYPQDIDSFAELTMVFDARGWQKAGDQLFQKQFELWRKALKSYPNSAVLHNNLAWLCARSKRSLDTALEHAEKATTMKPDSDAYLDTLAEVHFQAGRWQKAVELEKQCIRMNPHMDHYRKSLKRFKAGGAANHDQTGR